ncbi:DUF1803 domain-containing protein [Enterococcus pingfangensis]|uniref:DUF1803 domain-containing protein n=1 Tax=Enterococcus pingfangensis TaxID=2559924 RepID=UPI0010F8EFB9|nr:DUF1803 domain-containing protein [Enterococcus pingfangensis]
MRLYTNNQKTEQLLNQPEITELLSYFEQIKTPVILREIRKAFPGQKHLDKNLDFLIDNEIVTRQERRYQLQLAVVKNYPTTALVEEFIQAISGQYSTEELLVWLSEEFWCIEAAKTIALDFPTATCNRLEHAAFHLVTLNRGGVLPETLPNYFGNIEQPELFPDLAGLIGDVNLEFFTNQLGLLLERIIAGRAPRRESIFLTSLLNSRVVTKEPTWKLTVPLFEESITLDQLPIMDQQTRFFFVRELAEKLLGEQTSFTYLIKKKE